MVTSAHYQAIALIIANHEAIEQVRRKRIPQTLCWLRNPNAKCETTKVSLLCSEQKKSFAPPAPAAHNVMAFLSTSQFQTVKNVGVSKEWGFSDCFNIEIDGHHLSHIGKTEVVFNGKSSSTPCTP